MGAACLHVCLTRLSVCQKGRVHTNDLSDSIHLRQQLIELLRCDDFILRTGIGHDLAFVHLLVNIQNLLCLESLRRQAGRQRSKVQKPGRRRVRHRFAVYRHAGRVIILRNLILGRKLRFIRIGIHNTVLILEPILIIRRRLISRNRVQLPAYDQNHS